MVFSAGLVHRASRGARLFPVSTSSYRVVSIFPGQPPEPTLSSSGDYANSMRKEVTAHGGWEEDKLQVFQAWLWGMPRLAEPASEGSPRG